MTHLLKSVATFQGNTKTPPAVAGGGNVTVTGLVVALFVEFTAGAVGTPENPLLIAISRAAFEIAMPVHAVATRACVVGRPVDDRLRNSGHVPKPSHGV